MVGPTLRGILDGQNLVSGRIPTAVDFVSRVVWASPLV